MRLAWYWSRVFWGGLLGFVFLIWLWGYKLDVLTTMSWTRSGVDYFVVVGEGLFGAGMNDGMGAMFGGFEVDESEGVFGDEGRPFAPAFEILSGPDPSGRMHRSILIGHWLVVVCYLPLWLGALVFWQRRKRRMVSRVAANAGWLRIAIPVAGMVVMGTLMAIRSGKPPKTWEDAFHGQGQKTWRLLKADGMVTAEEIIEYCYQLGSHHDGDRQMSTAWALAGHRDDPIPALRRMMHEKTPERRAFAVTTAGYLGDVRLRPDLGALRGDKTNLGTYPGEWFWDTVGEAAESALKWVDKGGVGQSLKKERENFADWLKLEPVKE